MSQSQVDVAASLKRKKKKLRPLRPLPHLATTHLHTGLPTSAGGRLVETCTPSDWATPLAPAPPPRGPPAVALGKFDALHRGHARLATTAAAAPALHTPWLVSFSGMAAELGWAPRRPLVSPDDRGRVLASWAAACGGAAPRQRVVPFAQVRTLSPADFVDALCGSLGAAHVVVGEGYRFGHRAAGDTRALIDLCAARGVGVTVVPLVPAGGGETTPVSSSGVRAALAAGRLAEVEAALGRLYRLVAHVPPGDAPPPGGRRLR